MARNTITVVIKYEEGAEQPAFHANMECLGGTVVGVMFDDALEHIESLEAEVSDLESRIIE